MIAPDIWFLTPMAALVLGALALAPLGAQVLARGVVFIDLAVAQAAAAAALWAGALTTLLSGHSDTWITQIIATLGALLCAAAVAALARSASVQREALIGLLYVLGASAALLGARLDAHGRERLTELLAADVLWAGQPQVLLLAIAAVLVWWLRRRLTHDAVFYPLFAVVASVVVPVLGLFVVFALLVAPGLWTRTVAWPWVWAMTLGACTVGLGASWVLDAPSGACVAATLALWGVLSQIKLRAQ